MLSDKLWNRRYHCSNTLESLPLHHRELRIRAGAEDVDVDGDETPKVGGKALKENPLVLLPVRDKGWMVPITTSHNNNNNNNNNNTSNNPNKLLLRPSDPRYRQPPGLGSLGMKPDQGELFLMSIKPSRGKDLFSKNPLHRLGVGGELSKDGGWVFYRGTLLPQWGDSIGRPYRCLEL